mgnify:CR=1 FL=1
MPDIFLDRLNEQSVRVQAESVHGMLWLQTHFDEDAWDGLMYGMIGIDTDVANKLSQIASTCGLSILYP